MLLLKLFCSGYGRSRRELRLHLPQGVVDFVAREREETKKEENVKLSKSVFFCVALTCETRGDGMCSLKL